MNKEISAEMLLNYRYPERMRQWKVTSKGTFYRNYSSDAMAINLVENKVQLARDGFLRLLPEGLFFNEKSREEESANQRQWRLMLLSKAFIPIDSFAFRNKLQLEHEVDRLLQEKWDLILHRVFGYTAQQSIYSEVAGLLPQMRNRKGDLLFVQALLATLCHCPVKLDQSHRYSESDSRRCWMPMARFELLVPDLDAPNYRRLHNELDSLTEFIEEWLMPFDVKCDIVVRQHNDAAQPGDNLILDYNTEL
ncbi:MAG: hypothetical protein KBT12_02320 [Bacteroidales bacterium]|nr:hypothetical protein [Candidatus Physcousia equi]